MKYYKRELEKILYKYLQAFPAIGITGPRQSGKSTLLLHSLVDDYTYVTFDDPKAVADFNEDPEAFIDRHNNHVIFDEIQYVPEIFNYIKIAIDKDRHNYGKFILTSSSQFAFLKNVSESLAGRIGLLTLLPFQFREMPKRLLADSVFKGSYPELVDRKYTNNDFWYSAYFDTYLHKDVRSLSNIGDIRDFQRFIHLLAANAAQILNMNNYANAIGVAIPTIKRWLSILEASYIIFLLPPFYKNFGKRITKRPKIYFYDTGLISHLVGITDATQYEKGPMAGRIFENYIISEILKKETHAKTNAELFYLRSSNMLEIDLIIDRKQYKEMLEIKKTATFRPKMLQPIKEFMEANDKGYLLYNGKVYPYTKNIKIMNYKEYLK
jgi:predicted AAA+ superfamily ATPase